MCLTSRPSLPVQLTLLSSQQLSPFFKLGKLGDFSTFFSPLSFCGPWRHILFQELPLNLGLSPEPSASTCSWEEVCEEGEVVRETPGFIHLGSREERAPVGLILPRVLSPLFSPADPKAPFCLNSFPPQLGSLQASLANAAGASRERRGPQLTSPLQGPGNAPYRRGLRLLPWR